MDFHIFLTGLKPQPEKVFLDVRESSSTVSETDSAGWDMNTSIFLRMHPVSYHLHKPSLGDVFHMFSFFLKIDPKDR